MAAPHQRANAGREFVERKWLAQIVVGSEIEALDAVFHLGTLGQNQHRQAWFFHPQMAQNADAIEFWQIKIEDNQVKFVFDGSVLGQFAIGENIHRMVFCFQSLTDEPAQGVIVFGEKNSHA
jgi:hypothetical protein